MLPSSFLTIGISNSSSWEPSSTTLPLSMTMILSHFFTVARRCAIMMVQPVCLASIILSRAACTTPSAFESSALVASSSNTMVGLRMMARAMAKRCFWPPLSFTPRSPAYVSNFRGKSFTKAQALALRHASSTSASEMVSRRSRGRP
mmetsp:Transcript_92953/g.199350  ORF Transcript_92953/g.199350 Transcript_92953/m.199350 type:complete len:147 (+) Transcript_92953:708-1148(+)